MARAAESVGREDWGDPQFVEPLSLLVEGCLRTGRLTTVGQKVLRSVVLRHLRNRLSIQGYLDRWPGTPERALGRPLVITGLPRTGTSLLHNLLARDPQHRFLRLWEALHPIPPDGDELDEPTLVRQAETWLERFYAIAPQFKAIHPLTPRGPEECDALLQNAFASQHFDDMFDAPAYSEWFNSGQLQREYHYYALQLRVLSPEQSPDRRWLLKSPGHLGHLDALLSALPGAVVLHCHRDPAQAVVSYASLITTVRSPHMADVSPAAVGEQALGRCANTIDRALRVRAQAGEHQFVDVSYPALVADPVGTVRRIYTRLDARLGDDLADTMRRWVASHPADRHGKHRYDAERFGLTGQRIRSAFAAYLERFASSLAG